MSAKTKDKLRLRQAYAQSLLLTRLSQAMRLLIANFDCQNIVSKAYVSKAIQRLPKAHYAGINVVRYDPKRTLAAAISCFEYKPVFPQAKGLYYHEQELSVIIVFRFQTPDEFKHILYHEIGHYVFLRTLNQKQRDKWFYAIRPNETNYVSANAKQNSREDFAETYAHYCTTSKHLFKIPLKTDFIHKMLFNGIKLTQL